VSGLFLESLHNRNKPIMPRPHKEKSSKTVTNELGNLDAGDQQHRVEVSYKDCELVNVTVFSERAELTRKVCVELKEGTFCFRFRHFVFVSFSLCQVEAHS
jgi:hypothetical protein